MGRIKAGSKTSKIQRFLKKPVVEQAKQEVVATPVVQPCPVIIDYRVRKFAKVLRKKQKEEVTARMVADVKLGVRLQQDLEVLKQQLLNEIDGSYQANALPLEQLKQKVEELEAKLSQEPVVIQQIQPQIAEPVVEKQIVERVVESNTIQEVVPHHIKVFMVGLVILNIILLLK